MKQIFILLFSLFLLSGCALTHQKHSDSEPTSNISKGLDGFSPELTRILNEASSGTQVMVNQYNVALGEKYTSANGSVCRQLHWIGGDFATGQYKIVCKSSDANHWYQVNPITESQAAFYELVSRSQ